MRVSSTAKAAAASDGQVTLITCKDHPKRD